MHVMGNKQHRGCAGAFWFPAKVAEEGLVFQSLPTLLLPGKWASKAVAFPRSGNPDLEEIRQSGRHTQKTEQNLCLFRWYPSHLGCRVTDSG